MINGLKEHLHLINGDSAAGCLMQALGVSRQQLIVNRDPLHCGPAPNTDDWAEWGRVRAPFLQALDNDPWPRKYFENAERDFRHDLQRVLDKPPLYVWVSQALGDQLLIGRLLNILHAWQIDADCVRVMQFAEDPGGRSIWSMSMSPNAISQLAPEPIRLSDSDERSYRRAWTAYTSAEPAELMAFLGPTDGPPSLCRAMQRLVYRYPDCITGLSYTDSKLLESCVANGPKATRAIGYVMGYDETPDRLGDAYLFWRLLKLGARELSKPLISVTGDSSQMRNCEVEITPFGRQVLRGEANEADVNGRSDWVGGVNLETLERSVCRVGDEIRWS